MTGTLPGFNSSVADSGDFDEFSLTVTFTEADGTTVQLVAEETLHLYGPLDASDITPNSINKGDAVQVTNDKLVKIVLSPWTCAIDMGKHNSCVSRQGSRQEVDEVLSKSQTVDWHF